jgi:hypothetical protein
VNPERLAATARFTPVQPKIAMCGRHNPAACAEFRRQIIILMCVEAEGRAEVGRHKQTQNKQCRDGVLLRNPASGPIESSHDS